METNEPLIEQLQVIIHWSVRALAILMVFVIITGVVDVAWTLYQKLISPPDYILTISDMRATFGAFMAVLIAIGIGYWLVVRLPRFDLELGPGKPERRQESAGQAENAPSSSARTDVAKPE